MYYYIKNRQIHTFVVRVRFQELGTSEWLHILLDSDPPGHPLIAVIMSGPGQSHTPLQNIHCPTEHWKAETNNRGYHVLAS